MAATGRKVANESYQRPNVQRRIEPLRYVLVLSLAILKLRMVDVLRNYFREKLSFRLSIRLTNR